MAPAHASFEDALAGVTAFAAAVASDSDSDRPRSKKTKKDKKKKEKESSKTSKSKPSSKGKASGKAKKKKSKRDRHKSSDEGGTSSDSEVETVEMKLARGRAAAKCTRTIMSRMPQAKQSLREILWRLDNKEAVDISSIPNENLRKLLEVIFDCLKLLKVKEGIYVKGKGADSLLGQLGYILEEVPAQPSAKDLQVDAQAAEVAAEQQPVAANVESASAKAEAPPLKEDPSNGSPAPSGHAEDPTEIGPAMPEGGWKSSVKQEEVDVSDWDVKSEEEAKASRRVLGPALPPQVLLDQAAEVAEAMAAEEAAAAAEEMIGPPPPDMVAEVNMEAGDARTAEVIRILKVLELASREGKKADVYRVMGVERDASGSEVKKRYWRLSLLIHPDKCDHPRAQDAFNAVSQAAKDLQDAGKRGVIDGELEQQKMAELEREEVREQETARQWRVARGEATAEDLRGPVRAGPAQREEWITVLPAARRAAAPSQKSQTSFSQQGVAAINQDATQWSDTPAQKLLRLQQASNSMMPALESSAEQERAAAKAKAVDAYNEAHRAKPLVEQHVEKQHKEKKRKRDKEGKKAGDDEDEWKGSHPWRPFDREKDLQASVRPRNQEELMKQMGSLAGRFGAKTQQARKFL